VLAGEKAERVMAQKVRNVKVRFGARQKLPSSAGIELPPLRTGFGDAGALVIIRAVGAQV
jgi:hypothetical protein